MNLDCYYQAVLKGLDGILDPRRLEKYTTDLFGAHYPALAHLPGGSDLGMDGAIADQERS
jgi:hypothetical protein